MHETGDFAVLNQIGGMLWLPGGAGSGLQPSLHSVNSEYLNSQTPHKICAGKCVQCVTPRQCGEVVFRRTCTGPPCRAAAL